jgi:hypothetical protein
MITIPADDPRLFSLKAAISKRFGVEVPSFDEVTKDNSITQVAKSIELEPTSPGYTDYLRAAHLKVTTDLSRDPIKLWVEIDASRETETVVTLPNGCRLQDGFDLDYLEARYSIADGDPTKLKIKPTTGVIWGDSPETGLRVIGSHSPRIFDITKNGGHALLYLDTNIINQ